MDWVCNVGVSSIILHVEVGNRRIRQELFAERVLGVTTPKNIIKQIEWIAEKTNSTKIALCCFERTKECHRYNVALWLQKAGFEIEEFKVETKTEIEKPKVIDVQTSLFE